MYCVCVRDSKHRRQELWGRVQRIPICCCQMEPRWQPIIAQGCGTHKLNADIIVHFVRTDFPQSYLNIFSTRSRIVQNLRAVPKIWWYQIYLIFYSFYEFPFFSQPLGSPNVKHNFALRCFSKFIKESTCWLCRCHTQNGFLLLQLLGFSLFFLNFG